MKAGDIQELDALYEALTPWAVTNWEAYDSGLTPTTISNADVISSEIAEPITAGHKVLLDIDVPMIVVPSSTDGHSHLYIDVEVEHDKYMNLLDTLADCGIIEPGYASASRARGFTALRPYWRKKGDTA